MLVRLGMQVQPKAKASNLEGISGIWLERTECHTEGTGRPGSLGQEGTQGVMPRDSDSEPTSTREQRPEGEDLRASLQLLPTAPIPIPRIIRLPIGEHIPQPKVPELPLPEGPAEALPEAGYDNPPRLALLSVG